MLEKIKNIIAEKVHPQAVLDESVVGLQPSLYIDKQYLLEVCRVLRDQEELYFDFLANVSAVDYFPDSYFEVVYHLTSIPYQQQLTLKVKLDASRDLQDLPELPSVSALWRTADWHEREIFDLMGIYFTEHPDLRRILMPDDWDGYPLRKDYEDPETYHQIPVN